MDSFSHIPKKACQKCSALVNTAMLFKASPLPGSCNVFTRSMTTAHSWDMRTFFLRSLLPCYIPALPIGFFKKPLVCTCAFCVKFALPTPSEQFANCQLAACTTRFGSSKKKEKKKGGTKLGKMLAAVVRPAPTS